MASVVVVTKDADLSLEAVYNVAFQNAMVELGFADCEDFVAAESGSSAALVLPVDALPPLVLRDKNMPKFHKQEKRASQVVLLNMLLRSGNAGRKLRAVVPLFLVDLLNDDTDIDFAEGANFEAPDVMPIVRALYRRRGKGVTKEELEDIQQSNAILLGKAALLVHRVSYFPVLVDAIAALSCEALKADIREFDLFPDGHAKDVASAMRTLLAGSSLVNPREGATSAHSIYSIPEAHGRLRESLKSATYLVAGRINSGCRSPTTLSVLRSAGSLSINLRTLAVNSAARSRAVVFEMRYLIVSDELQQIRKLCSTMRGCFRHGGDAPGREVFWHGRQPLR